MQLITEYQLSPLATEDLRKIWRFGAGKWGVEQAETYGDKLFDAFEFLVRNPRAGQSIDEIRENYRRHIIGSHSIIYRLNSDTVEIIRILHQRMDPERHLSH